MTKTPPPSKKRDEGAASAAEHDDPEHINLSTIRALADIVTDHELGEIELRRGVHRVRITRASGGTVATLAPWPGPSMHHQLSAPPAHASAPAAHASNGGATAVSDTPTIKVDLGKEVLSPFVGTFYRSPSPEAPSFCEIGQKVKKGQVLCIVEAMKLMNEIEAEHEGTVTACLAENGQPVEFGQPLFRILP
jgi:acetyl-CoA carboxylase biotin carboxyl carrier protein